MPARSIRSLDELQCLVGAGVIAASSWRELPQDAIRTFASVTGDEQWIHVDAARAASESPWGTTIAHGFFTLSLLSSFMADAVRLELGQSASINYGLNRVRFPAPVRAGTRLRAHFGLDSCGPRPGGIETVWQVTVQAEGESKPVCVADWVLLLLTAGAL